MDKIERRGQPARASTPPSRSTSPAQSQSQNNQRGRSSPRPRNDNAGSFRLNPKYIAWALTIQLKRKKQRKKKKSNKSKNVGRGGEEVVKVLEASPISAAKSANNVLQLKLL